MLDPLDHYLRNHSGPKALNPGVWGGVAFKRYLDCCVIAVQGLKAMASRTYNDGLNEIAGFLIRYWQSQGMRIAPPATETQVLEFERNYGIEIVHEFRDYLLTVNGMLQASNDQCDANLFAFWQLNRIRPVSEECPELQRSAEEGRYFAFADYMVWSWAYAIDLASTSDTRGKVILVGGLREQSVASTFSEFVRLYVEDSPRLYPGGRS
jgi:hypothetical protein